MTKFHPYALLLGLIIGVMVFFALRHPLFAVFAGAVSIFGLDYGFKKNARIGNDEDKS
ncbi:MAG: hypothetical protein ACPGVT_10235 [Maricaulaceae bacterium]